MLENSQTTSNFNKCSALAEVGDHLATIDMDQKFGGL